MLITPMYLFVIFWSHVTITTYYQHCFYFQSRLSIFILTGLLTVVQSCARQLKSQTVNKFKFLMKTINFNIYITGI